MDYECNICGYEPNSDEAQMGICPQCYEDRKHAREDLSESLPSLRLGDSVQVFGRHYNHRTYEYEQKTQYLWTVVGTHEDGSLRWRSESGKTTFTDKNREDHTVVVPGLSAYASQCRTHDTTSSVIHWAVGDGKTYIIHQVPEPNSSELARDRILTGAGLEAA